MVLLQVQLFGTALGTNLKFYISVAKELKLKVRKFSGLIPTLAEVTREKLVGGTSPPILNRIEGVFRNFAKFAGKHMCQSLFFKKVANLSMQLY